MLRNSFRGKEFIVAAVVPNKITSAASGLSKTAISAPFRIIPPTTAQRPRSIPIGKNISISRPSLCTKSAKKY
jgi:hypothetical protein